nr:MAG TPA: hypothetical protein [Caudoviricetes sp.]
MLFSQLFYHSCEKRYKKMRKKILFLLTYLKSQCIICIYGC